MTCAPGCQSLETAGCSVCGNGTAEADELCDGADLRGVTCGDSGFFAGQLRCAPNCRSLDVSGCTNCGDGLATAGEECDGSALRDEDCESRGFTTGELGCSASCEFDTSACTGPRQRDCCEENRGVPGCVDADIAACVCASDPSCCSDNWDALCASLVEAQGCGSCTPVCGNDRRERGEVCDGDDLSGLRCQDLGFTGGPLDCAAGCDAYDSASCVGDGPVCGNGMVEGLEMCDAGNLGGTSCADLGFASGDLACAPDCSHFDTTPCAASPVTSCGDGFVNGIGELCDGTNWAVAGPDCAALILGTGTASCSDECLPDLSGCSEGSDLCAVSGWYNDGKCQPCALFGGVTDEECAVFCAADGQCDSTRFGSVTACAAAGRPDPDCGTCGDGLLAPDELCDGTTGAASGESCTGYGFAGGELGSCTQTCLPSFATCEAQGDCCTATAEVGGCTTSDVEACVCAQDPFCCDVEWDARCVDDVARFLCGSC